LNLPRNDSHSLEEGGSPIPPISPLSPPHRQQAWKDKESFLEPGPTYIAPGSGFFFGNASSRTSIINFLPSRLAGDRLLKQYRDAVHFIARVVHWPSVQTQYDNFWAQITVGVEPSGSLQAIVFAIMFSAVVSMNESEITTLFSIPKSNLVTSFQTATEVALGKANFLRTTKLETLQALVVYLIPMCRDEMSRAHSVLVGTAIRLAECMGLHRDPKDTYGLGPVESHVRRTVWCQLCFLDIRTAEAQGPRPVIRRDDFDTGFPLNINDVDLLSGNAKESSGWTDMTFSKIRFECNEMHRVIWIDRNRLEKKQVGLTHVLGKIESFRKAMEAKYHPILDENVPLQLEAKLVMDLLLLRMHIMVLHRYHSSFRGGIPNRLRQIILSTGTRQLENAVHLDTDPILQPWAWYCGAYQQWHTAFLLLVEVFSFPLRREADRIWRILDYVFETDPSMTREQKGRAILSGLRDRTGAYREFRKMRGPISMMSTVTAVPPQKQGDDLGSKMPLDFNSDPTAPASRSIRAPPTGLMYGPTEYPITSSARGGASQPSIDHGNQTLVYGRSPYNSSYTVASNTNAPPVTASLSQMTKASADVPSPVSSADSTHNSNWTFDAPSTFFMGESQRSKRRQSKLPGEQTSQTSPPSSDATGSPDVHTNPSFRMMAGQHSSPAISAGKVPGGDTGYPVPPPAAVSTGGNPHGLVASVRSGDSDLPETQGVNRGASPQAAGPPEIFHSDTTMVDIDWVSPLTLMNLPLHDQLVLTFSNIHLPDSFCPSCVADLALSLPTVVYFVCSNPAMQY
jgi:Fungal specific transcription factor domain